MNESLNLRRKGFLSTAVNKTQNNHNGLVVILGSTLVQQHPTLLVPELINFAR
jgi:hypothetical protein